MANAIDAQGVVFKNGSVTMLARVVRQDAANITQVAISSIVYSVYLLDDDDPDSREAVTGHDAESVAVADLIYDSLQTDDTWSVDATGYNFAHVLDVSTDQAFTVAGKTYLVVFSLTPASGQVILVRFRFQCV